MTQKPIFHEHGTARSKGIWNPKTGDTNWAEPTAWDAGMLLQSPNWRDGRNKQSPHGMHAEALHGNTEAHSEHVQRAEARSEHASKHTERRGPHGHARRMDACLEHLGGKIVVLGAKDMIAGVTGRHRPTSLQSGFCVEYPARKRLQKERGPRTPETRGLTPANGDESAEDLVTYIGTRNSRVHSHISPKLAVGSAIRASILYPSANEEKMVLNFLISPAISSNIDGSLARVPWMPRGCCAQQEI
ncbi:hypothetical protein C8J57DRAFT_1224275 [Mycena rebaudengoi]|nr:hypothetical protein C8J57DRAFT_1224275 [Mycena rebaudengoi]